MKKRYYFNPNAGVFWAFGAVAGYLVNDFEGLMYGLAITLGISFLAALLPDLD